MKKRNTMKQNKHLLILSLFILLFFAASSAVLTSKNTEPPLVNRIETDSTRIILDTVAVDSIINENDSFSIENFKAYLKQINAPHPHILYSIARQESGFRSSLFVSHNNLFGMKRPNIRYNKSIQNGQKWAKFEHWTHSVDDIILWAEWTTNGNFSNYSEQQFLRHIDNSYAHSGYSRVLQKHFQEYID